PAVEAGTLHHPPPGDGTRSRPATAATFSPAARRARAEKITGAAYRRRDSSPEASSTCVRSQPAHLARRGRVANEPANVTTSRGRACPHGRSLPPHQHTSTPERSRASTDSREPRTVITVVPPAPLARPSRHPLKIREGRFLCRHGHGDAVHHGRHVT